MGERTEDTRMVPQITGDHGTPADTSSWFTKTLYNGGNGIKAGQTRLVYVSPKGGRQKQGKKPKKIFLKLGKKKKKTAKGRYLTWAKKN